MTTRSRYLYVIYLLAGLVITTIAIAGLYSSDDRTPMGNIIQITFGLVLVTTGGYSYLNPDKTNNPSAFLFVAVVGFLLVCVSAFFLIHFYGSTGFFSTGDSTRAIGAIVFLLVVSVWSLFHSFALRNKKN